ncbi:hypothetical protein P8A21_40500 (plasmid) [Streptomyces poriferorum]|uniref:hypothetical protein n=1 Tax=Streptomyces poriferorum TaxID=2798799 RepID=UPI00273DBC7A|nr:hypothetical protein [Streptomyces sp. Alt1]WLQ53941.1 hypothetical protein P8A21_40500 [Streptomyces sp. Alt1]
MALLAEPQRLRSEKIVFCSWRAQSAVAAALMGAALLLGHSGWWLLVPHLVATFCGWQLKVTLMDHLDRRFASLGLHVVAILLALVALGVISVWFLVAVLVGWALVGGLASDNKGAISARRQMRCIARRRGARILDAFGRFDNAARCRSCRRAPARNCGTALSIYLSKFNTHRAY